MSETLKRNAAFLKLLSKANPRTRKAMLEKHCTKDFINCVSECCKNVLKGNVPLNRAQIAYLRRRKRMIRAVAQKKTSLRRKKGLIQKGGFLGFLLGPLVSLLGNLFGAGQ